MMQVAQRITGTAEAIAKARYRLVSLDILIVVDIHIGQPLIRQSTFSRKGIQASMASVSRGHCAIKDAVAHVCTLDHISGMPYAERVHGKLRWNQFASIGNDIGEQVALIVKGPAAIAETIKAN